MNLSQNTVGNTQDKTIKAMSKSWLLLVALILFSLAIVLSVVNLFTGSIGYDLYKASDALGFEKDFHMLVSYDNAGQYNLGYFGFWQIVQVVLTAVPGIIMAIAAYLIYSNVNKKNLSLARKMMTVNQAVCIALLAFLVVMVLMLLGNITVTDGGIYTTPDGVGSLVKVCAVSLIAIYLLAMFFCNSVKRAIDIASANLENQSVVCDITLFSPIFIAVIGILTIVLPIFTGNILLIAASVASGISQIIFGFILFDFRRKLLLKSAA